MFKFCESYIEPTIVLIKLINNPIILKIYKYLLDSKYIFFICWDP